MPLQNRETLRGFFRKGNLPTENNFNDLIDSVINRVDDGISKTTDEGLMLSPIGTSEKLVSFYKSIEDKSPAWSFNVNRGNSNLNINNRLGDSIMTLQHDGKVGINNENPEEELDVDGTVGMKSRKGKLHTGKIPADGKWHPVVSELNGCHAFEVVAGAGKKKTGKYALIHALALSTFGKSKSKIRITQAYYGVRCNMIRLRWTGTTYNYQLEMRTRCDYGGDFYVNYHIAGMWDDTFMDDSLGLKDE
ncbi:adhesin [Mangrovivirga cuniculi]|uniref:Adhesin n=1 Tax=Mangrovivirga cuniculi TaxID=2715131 RepID=A0A4D7JHP2_9BACT|nr:adhesin [Mangrovivirga cuniculi]QCK14533.1 adhesin [Mangrovivirga cuniculi]